MKALLVDAGNTRLKWALCEGETFLQQGAFAYDWSGLERQFDEQWDGIAKTHSPDQVILSNVAGSRLAAPMSQWLATHRLQEMPPLTINTVTAQAEAYGIRCAYQRPSQMGADRWAALIAAKHYLDGPCCVIDCGTALTIDLLTAGGEHAGGLIAPGLNMMHQSLITNTALIPSGITQNRSVFTVNDTLGAVQAGIMAAAAGTVQQVLQQCREHWQQEPVCVLTGGDADTLIDALPKTLADRFLRDSDWVLKGLAIIAGCVE